MQLTFLMGILLSVIILFFYNTYNTVNKINTKTEESLSILKEIKNTIDIEKIDIDATQKIDEDYKPALYEIESNSDISQEVEKKP